MQYIDKAEMGKWSLILVLFLFNVSNFRSHAQCDLSSVLVDEIKNYAPVVQAIIQKVLTGDFKGKLYNDTALFVDTVGARVVGSEGLDNGINFILKWMNDQGFDNVHGEEIDTPNWKRGQETLEMIEPRYQRLKILGYGSSVPTKEPINAEIIVVRDYAELEQRSNEIPGKIVVYDHKYVTYEISNQFRYSGAFEAGKRGAVAALVAAVSNQAMDLPHTGQMTYYDETVPRIPMASISVDAAEMLGRMHRRGTVIKLKMDMQNEDLGMTKSRNTFGQLSGSVLPNETVIVSGHIDSWDVGLGVQDDGAAVVMSVLVITLLKSLGLTPRRTIQAVGWTSEENGLIGVQGYIQQHQEDINAGKIVAAIESDYGLFQPLGYRFAGSDRGACITQEILKLFEGVNFTKFERRERVGSDISLLSDLHVPTLDFVTDSEKLFWYHHADSDTMSAVDSDELDKCLAVYAASAYVIADLSQNLYRSVTTDVGTATAATFILTIVVGMLASLRNVSFGSKF